jgi:tetrahydromethanopterin S-methyltransferase subunit G
MVDSRKEGTVAGDIEDLTGRVQAIEQKVDQLSGSIDQRFEQVDRRFEQVDRRFEQVDRRFDGIERALVEQRAYTEFASERLDAKMDAGFARLERKLDQILDLHQPRTPPGGEA